MPPVSFAARLPHAPLGRPSLARRRRRRRLRRQTLTILRSGFWARFLTYAFGLGLYRLLLGLRLGREVPVDGGDDGIHRHVRERITAVHRCHLPSRRFGGTCLYGG